MMRQYELVDRVRKYNPNADEDLLNRAYVYAMKAHGAQLRASGDPYFSHPLEVAAILTDLRLDDATIVAAVLHDTIEDTSSTREEIDRLFGPKIAALVEGLTKLKKLDLVSKKAEQAENFRKLLLAIADDVRVLLVKLADRLHNMRTLGFVPPDKRERIARETLDIYAPLAGRMGMQHMREELEHLSFKTLSPEPCAMIEARLADMRANNVKLIAQIEKDVVEALGKRGIEAEVKGREKAPYSIFRKIENKSIAVEQLSDIFGFRIVVDTVEDCYRTLGVVHTRWQTVPGRFKDYISTPKQNDYRSIHTTVVGPGRQRVELQIRTREMHEIAEYGIAAHALYKDGVSAEANAAISESRSYNWLRRTVELLGEGDSPEEFLEHTKLEMFHDQVFCFTPKGRVIALPRSATPIDFAYAIHTELGNNAIGCKLNGRIAPLLSELRNGDEVEIVSTKGQSPPAAWEGLVATGKARAAIRRATREAVRKQFAGLGRLIVARAFEKAKKAFADDMVKAALPRLARQSIEDVFSAVGRGEMYSGDVLRAVYPGVKPEKRPAGAAQGLTELGWFGLKKAANLVFKVPGQNDRSSSSALPIRGFGGDLPVSFAPDGGAVPGDRIVGIFTPGEGITVYPIQSPALVAFEDQTDRWLDVRWDIDEDSNDVFPARILLNCLNEPGALGVAATVIGDLGANIVHVEFNSRSPDLRDIVLDVRVRDLAHLNAIIAQLRGKSVVTRAERVNG